MIKLNHRKLLDGMLSICGVPSDNVDEKGLDAEVADKIGSFVMLRGHPLTLLAELKDGSELLENPASSDALNELKKSFEVLERASCLDKVVLDMSLAKGLDYYTGVIFEAVFKEDKEVGSIAAGGRYDNLIGMFGVFTIMEKQLQNQGVRAKETQVLVSIMGDDYPLAGELVRKCWVAKLKAEFMVHKRRTKHFDRANESRIPRMVIAGEPELREDEVKLINMVSNEKVIVNRNEFVEELVKRLDKTGCMCSCNGCKS